MIAALTIVSLGTKNILSKYNGTIVISGRRRDNKPCNVRKSVRDYFHADIDKKRRDFGCHKSENSTVTDIKSRELESQEKFINK